MDPHGTRQDLEYGLVVFVQSYEDPPDLSAFKKPKTKKHKDLLTEALAAAAVASAMSGDN